MKSVLVCLVVIFSVMGVNEGSASAQDLKPALVVQAPENVFTPMGFDDNDNAQLVLFGNLSDTCHKTGPVTAVVSNVQKSITVRDSVYVYSSGWCADVLTPYLEVVNLGMLAQGDYLVVAEKPDGTFKSMATLPITLARRSSPDDYLYAPVDHLHVARLSGTESSEIVLSGVFHNTCMVLKDTKVTYRQNNVIEVLPIAAMAASGCKPEARTFETTVKLNPTLHGRTLIHVRSLNGQSLNQVVEL